MSKDHPDRAKQIISQIEYITIASVSEDGQPWNSPVYSAFDTDYNFYWGSHKDSQHSTNIRANNKVFLVIYDSTVEAGKGEGVYVKATVSELDDPSEITEAHKLIQDRRPNWYWRLEQFKDGTPLKLYKDTPINVWMNDGDRIDGHYIDKRIEVKLASKEK
ncbi:MAG TPA: pyridoxamine 5'-phosphate oxidase family protein [Candidatus Saccharimonadales bacterium]